MPIRIIENSIELDQLKGIAKKQFGELVKAVVDIRQEIMAVGGELHADGEEILVEEKESKNKHLWGINLYPEMGEGERWIEFDSVINLKPSFGNYSRGVDDSKIQKKIREIVKKLVKK